MPSPILPAQKKDMEESREMSMHLRLFQTAAIALALCASAHAQDRGLSHPGNLSSMMVQDMLNAALDGCHQNNHQVSITILDRAGVVRASFRDENASPHTLELSQRKAYTALTFRMPSADFAKRTVSDPSRAPQANLSGVIALGGGLPIKAGDDVVGAIGVSGSQGGAVVGSNDEMCGKAGIDKIADRLN
jgi:uncharacterized protein GlcG (DUF336 family)